MTYVIYALIVIFTVLFSTLIGYLIPMMYREKKFREFWTKCPDCEKTKKKTERYSPVNFWKYGGYCNKHKTKVSSNVMFTVFFTLISLIPFAVEFFMTKNILTVNSISMYIVAMMLVYATMTDFKGLVIPDMCNIVIFLVGLSTMFYSAITTSDTSIYWLRLIGMVCIALPLFLLCLAGKSGFGDVKLFAALGIFLGWKNLILVLVIAVVTGCIYAIIKKFTSDNLKWKSEVPFGPFICLGTYITMMFGDLIIKSYLQLF